MPRNRAREHKVNKDDWETPDFVFEQIQAAFKYRLHIDVAASTFNSKCVFCITKETDALKVGRWGTGATGSMWWCNPSFRLKKLFLAKAHEQFALGCEGIMLLPSSVESLWFRRSIVYHRLPYLIWPGRISFIDPDTGEPGTGNCGGSVIVAFTRQRPLPPIAGQPWMTYAPMYDESILEDL